MKKWIENHKEIVTLLSIILAALILTTIDIFLQ